MLLAEIAQNLLRTKSSSRNANLHHDELGTFNPDREREHNQYISQWTNKSPKNRLLGKGQEAVVFHSKRPQNAGVVTKWLRNQRRDASTNASIRFLIDSQTANNTMAPHVYHITQIERPSNIYDFSIQLEKLQTTLTNWIDQYDPKQEHDFQAIQNIVEQLFKPELVEKLTAYLTNENKRSISSRLDRALISYEKDSFSNQLQQLLSYVRNDRFDLHGENFMIRLTSVGPQVVLTDPTYDQG